jgi:hypothetical protein
MVRRPLHHSSLWKEFDMPFQRLGASKESAERESFAAGFDAGKEWANDHAEAPQLERLADFRDRARDWESVFSGAGLSAFSLEERFAFELLSEEARTRGDAQDFWLDAMPWDRPPNNDGDWLRGFAEGALDVWERL